MKPDEDFYPTGKPYSPTAPRRGRSVLCRPCKVAYNREWRARRSPEKVAADTEAMRAYNRRRNLRLKYGVSLEDYERMMADQDGVCAICRQPESISRTNGSKPLAVDHDHDTGDVRGLLCGKCNTGIGQFGDDPVLLRQAIEYLERP